MKRFLFIIIPVVFIIFLVVFINFQSCNSSFFKKGIKEGMIHYDITYFESDSENPLIALLPTTMTIKFKNNSSSGQIEGWMGIFKSSYISNFDKKINSSLLKVMDKKYNFEVKFGEPSFGFDDIPGLKIEHTKDVKVIAGYKCKRAKIIVEGAKPDTFSVYFTNDILIHNPNWNTPFKSIDGVLMEFQASMRNVRMKCVATKVEESKIPDTEFQVPAGYKTVNREDMEKVIGELMKNS